MQSNELQPTALASWYQGESLESYLNAMFHYYEAEDNVNKAGSVDKAVDVKESTVIPSSTIAYRSLFETILAKCGLSLSDASFDEIIKGDYYSVLRRHGLTDTCNNPSFNDLGGVI